MEIIVFILLAGVWAAFLLPSFFDHRRQLPRATTRDFARSKALLASVASTDARRETLQRRRTLERRRRVLIALGTLAIGALVAAVWRNSMPLLVVAIIIDVIIAGYVGVLLYLRQQQEVGRRVVRIPAPEPSPAEQPEDQAATVRIVAS